MFLPYLTLLSAVGLAQAFTFTVSDASSVRHCELGSLTHISLKVTVGIDETNGKQGIGFDPSTIVPAGEGVPSGFPWPQMSLTTRYSW